MKLFPKLLIICLISIIPLSAIAQPLQSWIPPTNAFDKIHSDNGTINSVNFSMPLNIKSGSGISVKSNNATHTLTISSSTATATGTYNETQANNVVINSNGNKINFINGSGTNILVQNSQAGSQVNVTISSTGSGTNQGTYNQTLANNSIINSGGSKINFVNGTGNPIHIVNSNSGQKVNVTINSIGAVFTTRTIDLNSSAYRTIIDNDTADTAITATSEPATPQFVQTISAGNIPTDTTDIADYTAGLVIGGKNTNATTAKIITVIFTRNGADVDVSRSVTVTNGNFWEATFFFSGNGLTAGDKLGLKMWCTSTPCSSGGGLDFRYATIYIVPRQTVTIPNTSTYEILGAGNTLTLTGAVTGVTYSNLQGGFGTNISPVIIDTILGNQTATYVIGFTNQRLSELGSTAKASTNIGFALNQQAASGLNNLAFPKFVRITSLS